MTNIVTRLLNWIGANGTAEPADEGRSDSSAPTTHPELFRAIYEGEIFLVRDLLSDGTALDARWSEPPHRTFSVAHFATVFQSGRASIEREDMLREVLDAGADPNSRCAAGMTPLHYAARDDRFWKASLLIKRGADVCARTEGGTTPLHCASNALSEAIIGLLVEAGAEVNCADDDRCTPLFNAVNNCLSREDVVPALRTLVKLGADPRLPEGGFTALHHVACCSDSSTSKRALIRFLVRAGADPSAKDATGKTPIAYAREHELLEHIKLMRY